MKVQNMTSNNGNKVANQFIVIDNNDSDSGRTEFFQSYDSMIVKRVYSGVDWNESVFLDSTYWNYSRTTSKYRNQFLNETTKETQAKIDSGEYILTNLN